MGICGSVLKLRLKLPHLLKIVHLSRVHCRWGKSFEERGRKAKEGKRKERERLTLCGHHVLISKWSPLGSSGCGTQCVHRLLPSRHVSLRGCGHRCTRNFACHLANACSKGETPFEARVLTLHRRRGDRVRSTGHGSGGLTLDLILV